MHIDLDLTRIYWCGFCLQTASTEGNGVVASGGLGQVIHPPSGAQKDSAALVNLLAVFHREMRQLLEGRLSNTLYT